MEQTKQPGSEFKSRSVFVILFEQDKSFFINSTTQKNLWKVYDEHYRERHACTRKEFAKSKIDNHLPPFFLLDAVEGTATDAFQRCILWSKFFIEKGYSCLAGAKMIELAECFDGDEDAFYQSIKEISVREICPDEKNLFPNFKQNKAKSPGKKANRNDSVRLELVLHKNEHEHFKKTADEYGISMTELFLHYARHGIVINVDMEFIDQYLRKIEDYSNTLDAIISTILLSRDYFPAHMERMQKLSCDVIESNNEVKKEIIRLCRQIRRKNNW